MARTKAISLIQSGATKVDLAELSGLVIANIQKETLSSGLKSQSYTGNPATGSVEYKRFKNSASQAYGTARAAGKGDAITVPPTTVNLDTHREIVEEAAKFDLDTFGVGNIMARRADNHVDTVAAELDAAFFLCAANEGTDFTTTETDIEAQVEALIQTLETVKNDYVRGVPRNLIRLVLDPVPRRPGLFFYQPSCDHRNRRNHQDQDHDLPHDRYDRRRGRTAGGYLPLRGAGEDSPVQRLRRVYVLRLWHEGPDPRPDLHLLHQRYFRVIGRARP